MTQTQLNYLGLQETKRNNLAINAETNRANIARETETNRSNLASEKYRGKELTETKRHNKATEKQAKYATDKQATTALKTANISASAQKDVANINAAANKYAADTNAATAAANRASNEKMNLRDNAAKYTVAEMNNEANLAIKRIDWLLKQKEISQKDRASLRAAKTNLEITKKNISQAKLKMVNDDIMDSVKMVNSNLQALLKAGYSTSALKLLGLL